MDCQRFAGALAEALAGDPPPPPALLERLRAHASGCPSCADAADLVTVAAVPVAQRDPAADAPPEVWERIERGIARRHRLRRRAGAGLAVAAAAAGLALVAVAWTFVSGPTGGRAAVDTPAAASGRNDPWAGIEPTDPVEFSLGVDDTIGDDAWPSGDWAPFPEVDGLDARGRADLLRWLRSEEKRLRGEDSA